MHETGCSGLVHWDDPEGWNGEGGERRGSGWGTHVPQPENSLPCLSFPQPQLSGTPRVAPWHGEQLISYKSYVKKVNLNVSDAEAHSPLPHILSQLAFELKWVTTVISRGSA